MNESETNAEFVDRMENLWVRDIIPNSDDAYRLFALARRGADAADEIERLRAALRDALSYSTIGDMPVTIYENARAALGGR